MKKYFLLKSPTEHLNGNEQYRINDLFILKTLKMLNSAIERSHWTYRFDLFFYAFSPFILGLLLIIYTTIEQRRDIVIFGLLGLIFWTLLEYLLHRFILHSLYPFRKWHALHHAKPKALICLPTPLSMLLILLLIFSPSAYFLDLYQAIGLTYGVWIGYALYTLIHHAAHHTHPSQGWLFKYQRQHAIHHASFHNLHGAGKNFGVTNRFWDHLFRTS